MLDESEFLSDYGVRALSRVHQDQPYVFRVDGMDLSVNYAPAESQSNLFGGNSNWRGPIWFPVNYLIIESLQKFHHYYGLVCHRYFIQSLYDGFPLRLTMQYRLLLFRTKPCIAFLST